VDDQLGEKDELDSLRRNLLAPRVDGVEDAFGFAEESVHAHGGDAGRPHRWSSPMVRRADCGLPVANGQKTNAKQVGAWHAADSDQDRCRPSPSIA
jgi:hypothetical protein